MSDESSTEPPGHRRSSDKLSRVLFNHSPMPFWPGRGFLLRRYLDDLGTPKERVHFSDSELRLVGHRL